MQNVKIWLVTDLPWVWMLLWMSVLEICHSSSMATGWHWRGHRLLRVALSEISGSGPKWSFTTDTQRILNIRRQISPRWHFWSVAWPNLIKNFLDVQIIKIHVSGSEENFKYFVALILKLLMKNISNLFVRLFVISLLTFRYFSVIVSLFGAGAATFFTAPAPAPSKPFRRLRLRLRLRPNVSAPAAPAPAPAPHPWICWSWKINLKF